MTTFRQAEAAEFVVSYEGEALADYTMPVRDLAPALAALGDACDRANSLLNGDRASVSLQIRATRQGSFEIVLLLDQLFEEAVELLSGDFITSAANVKTLIFGGGGAIGLFGVIRWLRGRPFQQAGQDVNGNTVLEVQGMRLAVPPDVVRLVLDRAMRNHSEAVVEPVSKNGIDRMVVREGSAVLETVEKGDLEAFRESLAVEDETTFTSTVTRPVFLRPDAVRFVPRGKWRLNDGTATRSYTIEDQQFLRSVQSGEVRIGSRDSLVCEVTVDQTMDATGGLKTEYRVTDVIRYIPREPQVEMDL